jgi:soluble lytic murein transglycosylase
MIKKMSEHPSGKKGKGFVFIGALSPGIAALCFLIAMWFSPLPVQADIYMYVDEHGVMHFTNAPTSNRYQLYMKDNSAGLFFSENKYDHYIRLASDTYGVPFSLVKSVIQVESNFNRLAVSRKGAQGLMQIMPETAKVLKVYDPFDPWENIMGGTRYLKNLLERFNGDLKMALAGYNAGPEVVERHKGIPPYRETEQYVEKVLKYYKTHKLSNVGPG